MKKAIIIHGNGGGNPNGAWQPYVKTELEKLGIVTSNVQFPDAVMARAEFWLPFIKELGADENTILIGHSSGAVAAMRYAEQNKIFGSILTGVCWTDMGQESERVSGYYDHPWDWERIKNNQNWIAQFASIDDPYIPIAEARYVHEHLQTDYREFNDRGHFMQIEFPELVEAVKQKFQ
jgi:predicted alpha/beta hydrolase family esterase